jgi:acetate kinase
MNILVPNLGSTSLKYQLREMPSERVLLKGRMERVGDYAQAIASLPLEGHTVDAVAFKAVHAGERYRGTFVVDDAVIAALEEFLPAAPAHNAIYLTGIRAFQQAMPQATLVAAFTGPCQSTRLFMGCRQIGARAGCGGMGSTALRISMLASVCRRCCAVRRIRSG